MPRLIDMLKRRCDLKQGDWVICNNIKGIYISSLSERNIVISTYVNKKPSYKNINTCDVVKTDRINDGRLYKHAKKHIMWFNDRKTRKRKEHHET